MSDGQRFIASYGQSSYFFYIGYKTQRKGCTLLLENQKMSIVPGPGQDICKGCSPLINQSVAFASKGLP